MTVTTSATKSTAMCILCGMTLEAVGGLSNPLLHRRAVTRQTFEPPVCAEQFEFCVDIVIESPDRPSVGVVALPTFGPQPLAMDIFSGVT
jgi:hypothetical protein